MGVWKIWKMREEIVYNKGEEERKKESESELVSEEEERCCIVGIGSGFILQKRVVVVGYALTSKKVKSFFQPKLERLAR